MELIPLFKPYTVEKLQEDFDFQTESPVWVSIDFAFSDIKELDDTIPEGEAFDGDVVAYETNRYDVTYYDSKEDKVIAVFIYFECEVERVLAIDTVVQNTHEDIRYPLNETPFQAFVDKMLGNPAT